MAEKNCIFCHIITGAVPGDLVHQDEAVIAFRDIHPQAPKHFLVVPREHIDTLAHVTAEHGPLLGRLVEAVNLVARKEGLSEKGYRVVANVGPDSGMAVHHLHFHILGGRPLGRLG